MPQQITPTTIVLSEVEARIMTMQQKGLDVLLSNSECQDLMLRIRRTYELVVMLCQISHVAYGHTYDEDLTAARQQLVELQLLARGYFADPDFVDRNNMAEAAPEVAESVDATASMGSLPPSDGPVKTPDPEFKNVTRVDFAQARKSRPTTTIPPTPAA